MPEMRMLPFLNTFANCQFPPEVRRELADCTVAVGIDRRSRVMRLRMDSPAPLVKSVLDAVRQELTRMFQLSGVEMECAAPPAPETEPKPVSEPKPVPEPPAPVPDSTEEVFRKTEAIREAALASAVSVPVAKAEKKPKDKDIFGKISANKKATPMGDLTLDMGNVLVEGDVFNVEHRELPRRKAWVVCFDVTDYTGSIRVNKFMEADQALPIIKGVKAGQHLKVQGFLNMSRFEGEMVLEPLGIAEGKKESRTDKAEDKRVELHLHTNMSAMDALSDAGDLVKRAIAWGHPAIAITDHGVASAFPTAWHAGDGKIKIIYGVEAYFQNDVDDRVAIHGPGSWAAGE